MECVINARFGPFYLREREPVPIVVEAGWAPGPVWTRARSLAALVLDSRIVQPVASRYPDSPTTR
jgi:hypothetical protein